MSDWQSRITEVAVVDPADLVANPENYRLHPDRQRETLRGSLDELGIIAPVVVNSQTGHLIDGHARVEEYVAAGVKEVPVAYVNLSEEEERIALLSLDPISAMAVPDPSTLQALLEDDTVTTDNPALAGLFSDLGKVAMPFAPASVEEYEQLRASADVTSADMDAAAAKLEDQWSTTREPRPLREVVCPYCGGTLYVA